ncbi:hypothetical protein B0H16DRAFT_1889979 [Mycena metata]|uniref:Uncharacterized protein n=1 Tax=Mycena metata TaxID=1033252 RepID=A0AAD7IJ48_9AGAR|nr:hypothetical protein B0H16DRAFT_1889979 [Mycena metata]
MSLRRFKKAVIGGEKDGGEAADMGESIENVQGTFNFTMAANGLPLLSGGHGGVGGDADRDGGAGGNGQGPQIAPEEVKFYSHVTGGFGGGGGYGNNLGGTGGVGERPDFMRKLYTGEIGADMSLEDFCAQFDLNDDILDRLGKLKLKTIGALLEVTNVELGREGFGLGQRSELKRALKEFAAQRGTGK